MKRREIIAGVVAGAAVVALGAAEAQPPQKPAPAPPPRMPDNLKLVPALLVHQITVPAKKDDPNSHPSHILVLKDAGRDRFLLIWIGEAEAMSIALAHEGPVATRPLTHDVTLALVKALQGKLEGISIYMRETENTYYASIALSGNGLHPEVDSRPSDAIALALRAGAPIRVDERMLQEDTLDAIKARIAAAA